MRQSSGNLSQDLSWPPGLLAAGLLFWGWRTGWWIAGAAAAAILEWGRFSPWRVEFSKKDLRRVWDFTCLLFAGAVIYFYRGDGQPLSGYLFFEYFPVIFFAMAAAQVFGRADRVDSSAFSWFLRRRAPGRAEEGWIDFRPVYFALCLAAAGATNGDRFNFYAGFCVLLAWALWPARSPRMPRWVWMASVSGVILAGHQGYTHLHEWQIWVETKTSEWISRLIRREMDPRESRTRLGQIGIKQQSNALVYEVEPTQGRPPEYLRLASYDAYNDGIWYANKRIADAVSFDSSDGSWRLTDDTNAPERAAIVSGYLPGGQGLLPIPEQGLRIAKLPAAAMQQSALGAVFVKDGPGFMSFQAEFGPGGDRDDPPDAGDYSQIPESERPIIDAIARELDLFGRTPAEIARRIAQYFRDNFQYALYTPENAPRFGAGSKLETFLTRSHRGHCEYFAAATVLLFRAAGIPARYATGYAVVESSRKGRIYYVRERHAHAWALAYLGGHWRDVDNTPASWETLETQDASLWESWHDLWSRFNFALARWRWSGEKGSWSQFAPIALFPLSSFLLLRLFYKRGGKSAAPERPSGARNAELPGRDSEFYRVEQALRDAGLPQRPGETLKQWIQRARSVSAEHGWLLAAEELLPLHYRYRFDPVGLSASERRLLAEGARGLSANGARRRSSERLQI